MYLRNEFLQPQDSSTKSISIRNLAMNVLADYGEALVSHAIETDLDFEGGHTAVDSNQIRPAICALIENAIESMPTGGELSVTLVDGEHQWELEFADSGLPTKQKKTVDHIGVARDVLLNLIPFSTQKLESARQKANEFGGEIESWECPQGGSAHVLVFPIVQRRRAG